MIKLVHVCDKCDIRVQEDNYKGEVIFNAGVNQQKLDLCKKDLNGLLRWISKNVLVILFGWDNGCYKCGDADPAHYGGNLVIKIGDKERKYDFCHSCTGALQSWLKVKLVHFQSPLEWMNKVFLFKGDRESLVSKFQGGDSK